MVRELVDGVFDLELSLETEAGARTFHSVAFAAPHGVVLVDTGVPGQADDVAAALDEAGFDLADVELVLFTHQDGDHVGAASELLERTDALTAAHRTAAPYVDGREHPIKGDAADRYPPVPVDIELVEGVGFAAANGLFEVVETPGHAPGHVSLYNPESHLLLAGDALTVEDGAVQRPNQQFTPDPETAADSIRRLAQYDVERVLCFHGGYVEASSDDLRAVAGGM